MKFLKLSLKRGQAVVEYALLLMIAALSATAFLALDENLKVKVASIAQDLQTEVSLLPETDPGEIEGCAKNDNCLELSPPVAKFKVPSPNYKGREIRLIDESYDIDGYVEHYIWSVDGKVIKKSREEIEKDGGLVVSFRHSGTYNVNLIVIDNDGLISNIDSKTITVINRSPVLTLNVENEQGQLGSHVTVYQGCTATFYTQYTDPDLPYDALTLFSQFTDQSGVVSQDNTAPNQFTRDFQNLGTNTYYVRVTDEEGASVSATVTVDVIPNPKGKGVCGDNPNIVKPKFKIKVERSDGQPVEKQGTNVYLFPAGTHAIVTPEVEWGTYPAHQIPYYWISTQGNIKGQWYPVATGSRFTYPYPAPPNTFTLTTPEIKVTGMARDTSAISNDPNPALRGMSNMDTVILRVKNDDNSSKKFTPTPIISLNGKQHPSDKGEVLEIDVSKIPSKSFDVQVESVLSYDTQGRKIKGVRWLMPDGKTWRPYDGENGAELIVDKNGNAKWWYLGKVNSPDTIKDKRTLTWVKGAANTWTYQLEVINEENIVSAQPAKKTIKLVNNPNNPPIAVCNPNPLVIFPNGELNLTAKGSKDPDGDNVGARWSSDNKNWSNWSSITNTVNTAMKYSSKPEIKFSSPGKYTIYLEVRDDKGAITKANCPVEVKNIINDSYSIFLEFWYIEDRVARANQSLKVANRSTPMSKIYETYFTYYGAEGGETTGTYTPVSIVGEDHDNDWKKNIHGATKYLPINGAGTYIVGVNVLDKDGYITNCVNGKTNVINGKGYCYKGSHYFRTKQYTASKADILKGGTGSCTYYSVHKDIKSFSQYVQKWNKGATDKTSFYDVGAELQKELRAGTCY